MLELKEIMSMHDKAYNNGYDTRLKAADDTLFAWITQWDDTYGVSPTTIERQDVENVVQLPRRVNLDVLPTLIFHPLQEWEGYVVEISGDVFTARLVDVATGEALEMEEADFPISDVEEKDRDLLKPGAIFRWSIGYIRRGSTKIRASQIVFRRLPQWRAQDLDKARKHAEELAAAIPWK